MDKDYFETNLPSIVQEDLDKLHKYEKLDYNDIYVRSNIEDACESLNASLNIAEGEGWMSADQAWYLRGKYLNMERI